MIMYVVTYNMMGLQDYTGSHEPFSDLSQSPQAVCGPSNRTRPAVPCKERAQARRNWRGNGDRMSRVIQKGFLSARILPPLANLRIAKTHSDVFEVANLCLFLTIIIRN